MKTDLVVTGFIFHKNKVLLVHHKKLDKWLPVGGHIEKNETPDAALKREIKEETNLDIDFFHRSDLPKKGSVKKNLATPFHVNVHNVGDHDHCSLYYICRAKNPSQLKINKELNDYKWFSKNELEEVPEDVKNQVELAYKFFS